MGMETGIYGKRAPFIRGFLQPSILILSKRTKSSSLDHALALKNRYGTKLVIDLCDNVYFRKDETDESQTQKHLELSAKLNSFDVIVVPSYYLKEQIARHLREDMRFVVIPDAVEKTPVISGWRKLVDRRAFQDLANISDSIEHSEIESGRRLVWYGISGTNSALNGLFDVAAYAEHLENHHKIKPLSLTVISDNKQRYDEVISKRAFKSYYLDWNYFTIEQALRLHDISILPIRSNSYNLSKSANRLTTAMANGLAVCASAIPSYEPFRECAVFDDWQDGLAHLMNSKEKRQQQLDRGQKLILAEYSLEAVGEKWHGLLQSIGAETATSA